MGSGGAPWGRRHQRRWRGRRPRACSGSPTATGTAGRPAKGCTATTTQLWRLGGAARACAGAVSNGGGSHLGACGCSKTTTKRASASFLGWRSTISSPAPRGSSRRSIRIAWARGWVWVVPRSSAPARTGHMKGRERGASGQAGAHEDRGGPFPPRLGRGRRGLARELVPGEVERDARHVCGARDKSGSGRCVSAKIKALGGRR